MIVSVSQISVKIGTKQKESQTYTERNNVVNVYVLPDVKDEAETTKINKLPKYLYNVKAKCTSKAQNAQNKTEFNTMFCL